MNFYITLSRDLLADDITLFSEKVEFDLPSMLYFSVRNRPFDIIFLSLDYYIKEVNLEKWFKQIVFLSKMNLYVTYIVVMSLLIIVTNHRSCVNKLLGHNQIIPCDLLPLLLAFLSIESANLMIDSRQFDIAW